MTTTSEIIEEVEDVIRNQLEQRGTTYVEDESLPEMLARNDMSSNTIDLIFSALIAKIADCTGVYVDTVRQILDQTEIRIYLEDLPICDCLCMMQEALETIIDIHNTDDDGELVDMEN